MKMKKIIFLAFVSLLFASVDGHTGTKTTMPDNSIYEFEAHLIDQDGKQVGLNVYQGSPVVVTMFYASCNYSCPLLLNALKKMESGLDPAIRNKTRFLLISFDPENDTTLALKKLAKDYHLDLKRWKLVSPDKKEVRDIAAILNFTYRATPDGGFNHTSSLTLLNAQGVPVLNEEGIANAADSVAARLKKGI